jgi:hypothetical protein
MRFSNDRATTVPSSCGQTIEKMQQDAAIEEFLKPHLGKFSRIFRARCGYFPNKFIRLAHNGKNSVKLRLYIMEGQESGLRLPARRGRIALLLILFDRNLCVLTRLEIGANYEKDRKFLNADCRSGSLRNLSGHSF